MTLKSSWPLISGSYSPFGVIRLIYEDLLLLSRGTANSVGRSSSYFVFLSRGVCDKS